MKSNHAKIIREERKNYLLKTHGIPMHKQMSNPSYYMEGGMFDHETLLMPAFQKKKEEEYKRLRDREEGKYRTACMKKGGRPYKIDEQSGRFSVGCEMGNKRMYFRKADGQLITEDIK